jgi:hypothetical protein
MKKGSEEARQMNGANHLNIIIGQGGKVEEIYKVRKHNAELSRQMAAQHTERKREEDKTRIMKTDRSHGTKIRTDDRKGRDRSEDGERRESGGDTEAEENRSPKAKTIDLRV